MQESGFIKLHRQLLSWEWYKNINTKVLFVHLLLSANFKDSRYMGQIVPRGSLITTVTKLSDETTLTPREIRTALKNLKNTGEITVKSTNKFTVINLHNYGIYQDSELTNDKRATNERQTNDKLTTSLDKEEKELKNTSSSQQVAEGRATKSKKVYSDDSNEMQLSLLLAELMRNNNPNCKLPEDYQNWCKHFDYILRIDKREYDDVVSIIKFSQWDSFWKGNIRSPQKLRDQYDTLTLRRKSARERLQ